MLDRTTFGNRTEFVVIEEVGAQFLLHEVRYELWVNGSSDQPKSGFLSAAAERNASGFTFEDRGSRGVLDVGDRMLSDGPAKALSLVVGDREIGRSPFLCM
jgi:hypothetical protein